MRLIDLSPEWSNRIPVATGIALALTYHCPKNPKRIHFVYFWPIISTYPDDSPGLADLKKVQWDWLQQYHIPYWNRVRGDTFETFTLTPSISAKWIDGNECCHVSITDGMVAWT